MGVETLTTRLLLTQDESIADAVLAAAAARGTPVDVLAGVEDCVARWPDADLVLVGGDQARALASEGVRQRPGVYVVGFEAGELVRWSVPLGGQVIELPEGLPALSGVLSDDRGCGGAVVGVIGGSGGIGASTLAAGLVMTARRRGLSAALVDLDPLGGGVDLLVGAERAPGWRWPRLVGARGEVSDVGRFLPHVDGFTVVSMERPEAPGTPAEIPGPEAVRAVVGSLAHHHDLVVLDAGRAPCPGARLVLASCRRALLVAGTGVRSVAAASQVLGSLELGEPRLVVRSCAASRVPPDAVAHALGLPAAGVLPEDRLLARLAEQGEPPGRVGRRRWVRAVEGILTDSVGARDGR